MRSGRYDRNVQFLNEMFAEEAAQRLLFRDVLATARRVTSNGAVQAAPDDDGGFVYGHIPVGPLEGFPADADV